MLKRIVSKPVLALLIIAILSSPSRIRLTQADPETTSSVSITISEIYYDTPNDMEKEFVELYVWDDAGLGNINVSGWYITTYDNDNESLPYISNVGNYTYIVVMMSSGVNDLDASNGNATIYLNRSTPMLDNSGDEVSLYSSEGELIDFVRYGGGNGDPVLGNWPSDDPGITADNENKSIQMHGQDLDDSSNWVSAQPSPAEPNIFEWLMDPTIGLWYRIHNGVNVPVNLSGPSQNPRWDIHPQGTPLSASEIKNITEFLNYTYNYMKDRGLGTPETGGDGDVDVYVTKNGTFSGNANNGTRMDVDLGSMNDLEQRIMNKRVVEHEHIHLFQYKKAGGWGPSSHWSDLEGMAEYWAVKITMQEFNITYEKYIDIYKRLFHVDPTCWSSNTDRNFYEDFQVRWDYYWANHMFLRWIEAQFGEKKVEHIFKVRNITEGVRGMPAAVNKAFKEQGKNITFTDLFRNWTQYIYDHFNYKLNYAWDVTFVGTPLTHTETLNPWGTDYERIKINTTRNISFTFRGNGTKKYVITILKRNDTTYYKEVIWVNGSANITIVNHNYKEIILIKSQIDCSTPTTYTINITALPPPKPPDAEFRPFPDMTEVGAFVSFDASTSLPGWNGIDTMPITEYRWDFGDGNKTTTFTPVIYHSFSSSGTYYVKLTVYAPGAMPETDSTTHEVTVESGPIGGYTFPIKERVTTALILYLALMAILSVAVMTMKRRTRKQLRL